VPGRAVAVVPPGRLDEAWQGVEERAIDGGEAVLQGGQSRVFGGLGLVADQFGQDVAEGLWIEDASRLGDRAGGGVADAEAFLDWFEVTDLAQGVVAACQGLKEGDHDQGEEVIVVELAVFGFVAGTAVVMEVSEERPDAREGVERASRDGQFGGGGSLGGHDRSRMTDERPMRK